MHTDNPSDLLQRITIEPGKCGGQPCIRGKRLRVTDILSLLSAGASFEEILEDYPFLEREDIYAALEYNLTMAPCAKPGTFVYHCELDFQASMVNK